MHVCNACWREVVEGDVYITRCGHLFCASRATSRRGAPSPSSLVFRDTLILGPLRPRRRRRREEGGGARRVRALRERALRGEGREDGAREPRRGRHRERAHGSHAPPYRHGRLSRGSVLVRPARARRAQPSAARQRHGRAPRGSVQGQAPGGARRVQEGEAEAAGTLGAPPRSFLALFSPEFFLRSAPS